MITGHMPTMCINANSASTVYIGNGHVAIDCRCVYGERLADYCIETGEITYVDAKDDYWE